MKDNNRKTFLRDHLVKRFATGVRHASIALLFTSEIVVRVCCGIVRSIFVRSCALVLRLLFRVCCAIAQSMFVRSCALVMRLLFRVCCEIVQSIFVQVIHAVDAIGVSHACVQDGMENRAATSMAKSSSSVQNASRGFHRFLEREGLFGDLKPYFITVIAKENIDCGVAEEQIPIILPHEAIFELHTKAPHLFRDRFIGPEGLNGLDEFWGRSLPQDWMQQHPGREFVETAPLSCIPLRLHGDDAAITKDTSALFINFGSVMVRDLPSTQSRILILASRLHRLVDDDAPLRVLAWSWQCLIDGVMPSRDHEGALLTGEREITAGLPIAGGFRFLLTQIVGDWKLFREVFRLDAHDNRDSFCFLCPAHKRAGELCGWNYNPHAEWSRRLNTNAAFMFNREDVPLCSLPGFHLSLIKLDLMHICMLGIFHHVIGSSLWELVRANHWQRPGDAAGGRWEDRAALQLKRAYIAFTLWCKTHHVSHSQTKFSLAKLSMGALDDAPYFKSKAANCLATMHWIATVAKSKFDANPACRHSGDVANCFWGFNECMNMLQHAGRWLTEREVERLEKYRRASLYSFSALAHESIEVGAGTWHTTHKMHMYDHALRKASQDRHNPALFFGVSQTRTS